MPEKRPRTTRWLEMWRWEMTLMDWDVDIGSREKQLKVELTGLGALFGALGKEIEGAGGGTQVWDVMTRYK